VQPLPFEQAFTQLEERIKELKRTAREQDLGLMKEITKLEKKSADVLAQAYQKLSPLDIVKVARHPQRPHTSDYIKHLITDFTPLAGDRMFADDQAIWGGMGRFRGKPVMVMGHEKGRSTETRLKHNFGSARPEGYRKAIRLMELADRFGLPILTFIDTIGAHAAVEAEERGQAQAIASCIEAMLDVSVPVVATVIGEGGSGGAIALAAANVVLMLQYAIYTVITPEACATILWRSAEKAEIAAEALKFTSDHLKKLGVVEDVIAEPPGGAHRNALSVVHQTGDMIEAHLEKLAHSEDDLVTARHMRFQALGRSNVRL
jgi:acetyl-CoA carboxylase carboxyl transferase subunit alpha